MTNGERLRELLAGDTIIMAPGAYDAWSAKLVAQAGFPAVYMTGYGVSASTLGAPDIGLISFKEMLDAAQNIVRSAGIAALCDADTGFGGRLNVMRWKLTKTQAWPPSSWKTRSCPSAADTWRESSSFPQRRWWPS